jgi:hypothetical protein
MNDKDDHETYAVDVNWARACDSTLVDEDLSQEVTYMQCQTWEGHDEKTAFHGQRKNRNSDDEKMWGKR